MCFQDPSDSVYPVPSDTSQVRDALLYCNSSNETKLCAASGETSAIGSGEGGCVPQMPICSQIHSLHSLSHRVSLETTFPRLPCSLRWGQEKEKSQGISFHLPLPTWVSLPVAVSPLLFQLPPGSLSLHCPRYFPEALTMVLAPTRRPGFCTLETHLFLSSFQPSGDGDLPLLLSSGSPHCPLFGILVFTLSATVFPYQIASAWKTWADFYFSDWILVSRVVYPVG